jgi:hypothetical protein
MRYKKFRFGNATSILMGFGGGGGVTPHAPTHRTLGGDTLNYIPPFPVIQNNTVTTDGDRGLGLDILATKITANYTGRIDTLRILLPSASVPPNLKLAIYSDDGSNHPLALLGNTADHVVTGGVSTFEDVPLISGVDVVPTIYWIAVHQLSGFAVRSVSSGNGNDYGAVPYANPFPNPWTGGSPLWEHTSGMIYIGSAPRAVE